MEVQEMNITNKEVIKALGISKSTYYKWKKQGILELKIAEKAKLLELMEKGQALQKKAGKRIALVSSPDTKKGGGKYAK